LCLPAYFALALAVDDRSQGQQRVVPVEGEPFSAKLAGVADDWTLRFDAAGEVRELRAIDLAYYGAQVDRERVERSVLAVGEPAVVLLADGGRLAAQVKSLTGDRLVVESDYFGEVSLPLELLRGAIFRQSADPAVRDRLEWQVAHAEGNQDQVLLENGDRAEGVLRGAPVGPQAGTPEFDRLALDVKGEGLVVPLENVAALVFNPALVTAPRVSGMHAQLGLDDGSLLVVQQVHERDGLVTLTLPGGVRLSTDAETMWEETVYLRPATPRVVYLTDVRPLGYKHIPFLSTEWPYEVDRSVLGGKLRSGRHVYSKGLGMHSASRLAYEFSEEFRRLEAELAIDALAGERGSAICRVYVDRGDGAWQPSYTSPVIRGGENPLPLSLDLRGVKRLALIVEFADRGDECDYLDVLNARLIR
jgi:hypothetical protein